MPFWRTKPRTKEEAYFLDLQRKFDGQPPPAASAPTDVRDPAEQLAELSELHRTGALTDQEFEAAKAKLVAG